MLDSDIKVLGLELGIILIWTWDDVRRFSQIGYGGLVSKLTRRLNNF